MDVSKVVHNLCDAVGCSIFHIVWFNKMLNCVNEKTINKETEINISTSDFTNMCTNQKMHMNESIKLHLCSFGFSISLYAI